MRPQKIPLIIRGVAGQAVLKLMLGLVVPSDSYGEPVADIRFSCAVTELKFIWMLMVGVGQ